MTIDLTALLAQAESAAARQDKAAREAAAKREAADLSDDRRRAVRAVAEILDLETAHDGWNRLEVPPEIAPLASRSVWHPTDNDELRFAFRHRGVTNGGDVLTVVALAPETGEWIAAPSQITGLATLPDVVADARSQADRWDEMTAADEEGLAGPDGDDPAVVITAESVAEALRTAVRMAVTS